MPYRQDADGLSRSFGSSPGGLLEREGKPTMRENVAYVAQSKYFSPAFNAAIFDGPIRIYFAQYQEAQALKVYFNLQQRFGEARKQGLGIFKNRERNIFVMLYPTEDAFDLSFGPVEPAATGAGAEAGPAFNGAIACATIGDDYVIGVKGPVSDQSFERICIEIDRINTKLAQA